MRFFDVFDRLELEVDLVPVDRAAEQQRSTARHHRDVDRAPQHELGEKLLHFGPRARSGAARARRRPGRRPGVCIRVEEGALGAPVVELAARAGPTRSAGSGRWANPRSSKRFLPDSTRCASGRAAASLQVASCGGESNRRDGACRGLLCGASGALSIPAIFGRPWLLLPRRPRGPEQPRLAGLRAAGRGAALCGAGLTGAGRRRGAHATAAVLGCRLTSNRRFGLGSAALSRAGVRGRGAAGLGRGGLAAAASASARRTSAVRSGARAARPAPPRRRRGSSSDRAISRLQPNAIVGDGHAAAASVCASRLSASRIERREL